MSAYEKTGDWQSPRKKLEIEEQRRLTESRQELARKVMVFESYMELVDIGMITTEMAMIAIREELGAKDE